MDFIPLAYIFLTKAIPQRLLQMEKTASTSPQRIQLRLLLVSCTPLLSFRLSPYGGNLQEILYDETVEDIRKENGRAFLNQTSWLVSDLAIPGDWCIALHACSAHS